MTHDYIGIADAIDAEIMMRDRGLAALPALSTPDLVSIKHALLGMHKLMQPVSGAMYDAAMEIRNEGNGFDPAYDDVFEAMRSAMLAELTPALGGEV